MSPISAISLQPATARLAPGGGTAAQLRKLAQQIKDVQKQLANVQKSGGSAQDKQIESQTLQAELVMLQAQMTQLQSQQLISTLPSATQAAVITPPTAAHVEARPAQATQHAIHPEASSTSQASGHRSGTGHRLDLRV